MGRVVFVGNNVRTFERAVNGLWSVASGRKKKIGVFNGIKIGVFNRILSTVIFSIFIISYKVQLKKVTYKILRTI